MTEYNKKTNKENILISRNGIHVRGIECFRTVPWDSSDKGHGSHTCWCPKQEKLTKIFLYRDTNMVAMMSDLLPITKHSDAAYPESHLVSSLMVYAFYRSTFLQ